MKTLIAQEGYTTENFESLSLLQATYAAETASILIKALKYFMDEQKWDYNIIKSAMHKIRQLSIKYTGITGSITIDSENRETSSTFVVHNFIPPLEDDQYTICSQARAHIFYSKSDNIHIQYINAIGRNSTTPTIVYADGTTDPPKSTPEQLFVTPIISK